MNDKIKELAMRSGLGEHLWLNNSDPTEEEAVQKFAELILKECISILNQKYTGCKGEELLDQQINDCVSEIKERFGIE
jgi:hypothetical protein